MKRIPYTDPCVNGLSTPNRPNGSHLESNRERPISSSLHAANIRLAALREQHGVKPSVFTRQDEAVREERSPDPVDEKTEETHTVNVWLAPLHKIFEEGEKTIARLQAQATTDELEQPSEQQVEAPSLPETIQISPQLLAGMLREEVVATGRVWLLIRAFDKDGRGWVDVSTLRESLTKKDSEWRICGWRRLRQILADGEGEFWRRDERGRLWLIGQAQVAINLEVLHFSRKMVELPCETLLNNVGTVRAAFFAAQHTGEAPISRATLEQITGVPERTQRAYDGVTKTQKEVNWGVGAPFTPDGYQEHLYQHGRAAFVFKDRHGQRQLARQLPNSYTCPFRVIDQSNKGLNRKLQDLVKQGRRGNVRFDQRYFSDGRSYVESKAKGGFIRDQKVGGRNVWIFFGV